MTQRRRMSRAAVERTPEREVFRGISARSWWPVRTDPAASVARLRAALAERAERRAVERTGRVLVAWLIGRWRR